MVRPFRYLRDPLFLFCLVLYFVNRFGLKPLFPQSFFHDHLNDLICIPFWIPILLWLAKKAGLRRHDNPPLWAEVFVPTAVWSVLFELVFPRLTPRCVADPWDMTCYAAGALLAFRWWNR